MKITFSVLFLLMTTPFLAQKEWQFSLNIDAGIFGFDEAVEHNFTEYQYVERLEFPISPGLAVGIRSHYEFSSKWSLVSGLKYRLIRNHKQQSFSFYAQDGEVYFMDVWTHDHSIHTLQMPLLASYNILKNQDFLKLELGIVNSYFIFSKYHFYEDEQYQFQINSNQDFVTANNRFDLLLHGGLTINISKKIALGIAFNYDPILNSINRRFWDEDVFIDEDFEMRLGGLNLSLAYYFYGV